MHNSFKLKKIFYFKFFYTNYNFFKQMMIFVSMCTDINFNNFLKKTNCLKLFGDPAIRL